MAIATDDEQKLPSFKDVSAKWKPLLNFPKRELQRDGSGSYVEKPCPVNREQKISAFLQHLHEYKCEYYINKRDGSVTFFPSPFLSKADLGKKALEKAAFLNSKQLHNIMQQHKCSKLEYPFDLQASVVETPHDLHPFIVALELAYFKHYPLRLSPSHLWLLILHAIGTHIDHNAETLRAKFVTHQGKKELSVVREEFVKGSLKNDWSGVIKEFAQKIDENTVKDTVPLLEVDFSDSTAVEKIAGKVAIMDMMKRYFSFGLYGGCGFPQITLGGKKEDWVKLKRKASKLLSEKTVHDFGKKWSSALLPLIDRFICAYDGKIDCVFWNAMIRRGGVLPSMQQYGMDSIEERRGVYYSGWFHILFPFLSDVELMPMAQPNMMRFGPSSITKEMRMSRVTNHYCVPYSEKEDYVKNGLIGNGGGTKVANFPSGLASAPVKYTDLSVVPVKEYPMKFIAGFIGCNQATETLEISPKIGWIIAEK
eukprot:156574_1